MLLCFFKERLFSACALIAVSLVCAFSQTATAQQKNSAEQRSYAEKLAELRIEVDDLDASIRSRRARVDAELSGLETRLAELKVEEDAARLRVTALEGELSELKSGATKQGEQKQALFSVVEAAALRLETAVKSGLPYKTQERLAALSQILDDLRTGQVAPEAAAVRIWRFAEDERRLAAAVERSEIKLSIKDGEPPRLVQAVRVGMVALYTYSANGTWGSVVRDETGAFSFFAVRDKAQIRDIKRLFESVEKKIYEGRYTLPIGKKGAAPR
jgi:hypothetical protein